MCGGANSTSICLQLQFLLLPPALSPLLLILPIRIILLLPSAPMLLSSRAIPVVFRSSRSERIVQRAFVGAFFSLSSSSSSSSCLFWPAGSNGLRFFSFTNRILCSLALLPTRSALISRDAARRASKSCCSIPH